MRQPAVHKIGIFLLLNLLACCITVQAQLTPKERDLMRSNINRVAQGINARVGVSVSLLEAGDSLTIRGEERFPMMSVYKLPIAIAVLKELDKGTIFLEKYMLLPKDSVFTGEEEMYSDANFPERKITVGQLLTLMLVQGSNTACDQLLALLKGPANVQPYLDDLNIRNMAVANTEREVNANPILKDDNWSTPNEMVKLLAIAYTGDYLSTKSHDFLWDKMTETVTGPNRLKGLLPKDTRVAHRTGTGYGVYNDVGMITLPVVNI
jgi:beta-lactamase class A